jgi:cysteine desulfurase
MHYFDHNATTPLHPSAEEAWLRASRDHWYNASSLYREAGYTAQLLEVARERLADLLGCEAQRILFTSGATEANNALFATLPAGASIAHSAVEHPSVSQPAEHSGAQRQVLPVNSHGLLELETVASCCRRQRPTLLSCMAANNESGTLQFWQEIAHLCKQHGVRFHTDASQWLGKLPAHALGLCDYITGSAHKFGGPKGVGFLVLATEEERLSYLRGGPQENGRRAGTENYPAVEAMITALEQIPSATATHTGETSVSPWAAHAAWRDAFEAEMQSYFPGLRSIGQGAVRLWNTSLLVMPEHSNLKWLTRLSRLGFAISTGSACSSGREGSSVVVQALGASTEELRRVVRLSSYWSTTQADWQALAEAFLQVGHSLQS